MRGLVRLTMALLLINAGVARAQVPDWVAQIIAAAALPVIAHEARSEGVANSDILAALDALRGANVPAADARNVLDEARKAHRDHGPVDNFGAFVQAQLASGKRGRELAAAIRAEHVRNGKGKRATGGLTPGRADNAPGAKGRSDARDTTKGAAGQKGRSAGAPESKRPDGKGRPQR
jgi:hypothetical protein